MENSNRREDLDKVKAAVLENLSKLPPVPSVPIAVMPPSTKVGAGFFSQTGLQFS
jgi:hypothetical protein